MKLFSGEKIDGRFLQQSEIETNFKVENEVTGVWNTEPATFYTEIKVAVDSF
jgi:hypothetical protein